MSTKVINKLLVADSYYWLMFLVMPIEFRRLVWVGCGLAFLALGKVGFVSGFCVPCHVLKIALGRAAKSWVFVYVQDVE